MLDGYQMFTFGVTGEHEDQLVAELGLLGTLGLEVVDDAEPKTLRAYFPDKGPLDLVPLLSIPTVTLLGESRIEEQDWLAPFREAAEPFAVGARLWVDPTEGDRRIEPPPGRCLLHLPARRAFGIGSHESTRLAIELMERIVLDGRRVLDVGAGTGILSFAARLAGARQVVGIEVDPGAALVARENQTLNDLAFGLVAGTLAVLSPATRFEVALVNVLPEKIDGWLGTLATLLPAGASCIFSGVLEENEQDYRTVLTERGFLARDRVTANEWVAFLTERA